MIDRDIHIYLMDEDIDGCIQCKYESYDLVAYKVPKNRIKNFEENDCLGLYNQAAIYFLLCTKGKQTFYVGQARKRKNNQAANRRIVEPHSDDEWDTALIFTTKDALSISDLAYLENYYYNAAKSANLFTVTNRNEPSTDYSISDYTKRRLELLVKHIDMVVKLFGYSIFLGNEACKQGKNMQSRTKHSIKDIEFSSSLTGKMYRGFKNTKGTLSIVEIDSNYEIPNRSNPSKKEIVAAALNDLGVPVSDVDKDNLYQMYRKLSKLLSIDLSDVEFYESYDEDDENIYYINDGNHQSVMIYNNNKYILKANSYISINLNSNNPTCDIQRKDIETGIIDVVGEVGVLKEDKCFNSASSAAKYVKGYSVNGLIIWKDKNGVTFKEKNQ